MRLHQGANPADQKTIPTVNRYVCHDPETKLRVFQFMFLHRRIATNNFLFKIGLKQADSCSFKNSGKTFING